MKHNLYRLLLLPALLLATWSARAQTVTLQTESFEIVPGAAGSNVNTATTTNTSYATGEYFVRASVNTATGAFIPSGFNLADGNVPGRTGSWYWAGEGVQGGTSRSRPGINLSNLTLNPVNVASYGTLKVLVAIASTRGLIAATPPYGRMENDDTLKIQTRFTVGGVAGDWKTVGQFIGDNLGGTGNGRWRQDVDLNNSVTNDINTTGAGYSDGASSPSLGASMVDFSFDATKPAGATLMEVRVRAAQWGTSEEFAFDNIRVTGVASSNAAPSLGGIETTALVYTEGDPATTVTTGLTVSDANDANIASARVRISQNYDASEDRLTVTLRTGITGTFNTTTNELLLTGTASKADYEAVLRSVQYQNIDAVDPSALDRKVEFRVTDPAGDNSGVVERTITIVPTLSTVNLPYSEDFTTDGQGSRYTANSFTTAQSGTSAAFLRTNATPVTSGLTTFTGISNSWYWYANVTSNNTYARPFNLGVVQTRPISTTGYANLNFSLKLGASSSTFNLNDYLKLYYRSNNGSWVLLGQFRGTASAANESDAGSLRQDDVTNIGATPTGTIVTPTLTAFNFALPASVNGTTLDFKIEVFNNSSDENIAFDLLQLTGTANTTPTISNQTRNIAENSANGTNVGAAIVAADADAGQTLTYAITAGNTSGAFAINSSTGQITVANSAALNYEATQSFSLTVQVTDNGTPAANASATVTVNVLNVNEAPTAVNDSFTVAEDSGATVLNVLANDSDPDAGTTLTVTSVTQPANGTVTLVSGVVRFTPAANFNGTTTFTYTISDGALTSTATVTMTVTPVNDPPTAVNDSFTVNQNSGATVFDVLANDSSAPDTGETLTVTGVTQPANGTVTLTSGVVRFTPTAGFAGTTSFTYTLSDGNGGTATGTVTVTVNDVTPPTVSITSAGNTNGGTTSTSPIPFTVTFSEDVTGFVQGDLNVAGGTVSGFTAVNGTTYTFNVTPSGNGTVTVNIAANVAQDAATNGNTVASQFSVIYAAPTATVTAVIGRTPSPTATAQVVYTVVFSASVSGLSSANFSLSPNTTGASVTSVSGSGDTYTVVVNTGTGDGTLRLNVQNSTGVTPTLSNVPYTSGTTYTIIKSFAAAPTLRIQAAGSAIGNGDVTAFVDVVQVLNASNGSAVANSLQNASFETNNVDPSSFKKATDALPVTADFWSFTGLAGISRNGSAFGSTAADGTSVALIQSAGDNNASISQSLAVPTGSYQVSFQAMQRNYTTKDQRLNVFLVQGGNTVFIGNIQPNGNNPPTYDTFTSATFNVTAPALTATITSPGNTNGGNTGTSPISFTVSFSQNVTGFTASDLAVNGGTVSGFTAVNGTTYTFSVTPSGNGLVTVDVPANAALDANNTGNSAATQFGLTYTQPVTATPVVLTPANGSFTNDNTPTYSGTAVAGSNIFLYVDGVFSDTTFANAAGNWRKTRFLPLADGPHTIYVTAQATGQAVSNNSNTNTFVVDTEAPTVTLTSSTGTSGSSTTTSPFLFTATFSENVTGFAAGDLTVTNGTVTSLSGSGTTYNFTVTPTTPGTATTVQVAGNSVQDAATNGNVASNTYTLTFAPTSVTWNGSQNVDWYTAANWTPAVVPTATLNATIPTSPSGNRFPVIASGAAVVRNLTINSGATLNQTGGTLDVRGNLTNNGTYQPTGGTTVLGTSATANLLGSSRVRFWNLTVDSNGAQLSTSAGASVRRLLTLDGNLTTNGNDFVTESDASRTAMVVNNGSSVISGNVTVQRYISTANAGLGYRHYSSPVSNATVNDLGSAGFTPVVNPQYNTAAQPGLVTPFPNVFGYDQSRLSLTNDLDFFSKGWFSPNTLSDALTVAKGYAVNIAGGQTFTVTGPQNNGTYTQTLARGPQRGTPDQSGWHLVGNPYPSPLDYSQVAPADRVNMDGAIYVFASNGQYTGNYGVYNNGVGNISPVLPLGQGFFTRVSQGQTSGSLTLRNSQRVTTYNTPAYNRTSTTRPLVQLDLQGASHADPLYVYFEQGATTGMDTEFDAVKLPNTHGLNLSAVAGNLEMAIDGLPLPTGAAITTVPLQVRVPATGTYTLHAASIVNLPAGLTAYLRDRQTGAVQDLSQQPDYTFSLNAAYTGVRFELFFTPQRVTATAPASLAAQVAVFPNPAHKAVFVELPATLTRSAVSVALVDALGRTVLTQQLTAASSQLSLEGVAAGVYAVRLHTAQGTVTKKLTVE